MTVRNANVKGISFLDEYEGSALAFVAIVTFDLATTIYTGGSDTVTIGGGGFENGVATTLTLAQMVQNRRRDGKTVTLYAVMPGLPGRQAAATNGPVIYVQAPAVSAGNIISITLNTALTGGSAITCPASYFDSAASVFVLGQAVGY